MTYVPPSKEELARRGIGVTPPKTTPPKKATKPKTKVRGDKP